MMPRYYNNHRPCTYTKTLYKTVTKTVPIRSITLTSTITKTFATRTSQVPRATIAVVKSITVWKTATTSVTHVTSAYNDITTTIQETAIATVTDICLAPIAYDNIKYFWDEKHELTQESTSVITAYDCCAWCETEGGCNFWTYFSPTGLCLILKGNDALDVGTKSDTCPNGTPNIIIQKVRPGIDSPTNYVGNLGSCGKDVVFKLPE